MEAVILCFTMQHCHNTQAALLPLRRATRRMPGVSDMVVKYITNCESRLVEDAVRHEVRGMELASALEACLPLRGAYAATPPNASDNGVAYYILMPCVIRDPRTQP